MKGQVPLGGVGRGSKPQLLLGLSSGGAIPEGSGLGLWEHGICPNLSRGVGGVMLGPKQGLWRQVEEAGALVWSSLSPGERA